MKNNITRLLVLLILSFAGLYIAMPNNFVLPNRLPYVGGVAVSKQFVSIPFLGKEFIFSPELNFGLDIRGGVRVLLEADMTEIASSDRVVALESAKQTVARRVDLYGVNEPLIQTIIDEQSGVYRIAVELAGVGDIDQAINLIGSTAQLEFRTQDESLLPKDATPSAMDLYNSFIASGLTGNELERAQTIFDSQSGKPVVELLFNNEGSKLFYEITQKNVGKPVGIFIDDQILTLPIVQTPIADGRAIITGDFTTDAANQYVIQLNSGALPVPLDVVSLTKIGATLGQESIQKSVFAGIIGLSFVMVFMIYCYGLMGFVATIVLLLYAIASIVIYKILGITLSLPGIAGFILSVGMAVDANILIFERIKEERRIGKSMTQAVENGFGRAWDSIKDANAATILICTILYNPFNWSFLNTSGLVRGFAVTLFLGILMSLITGVFITRTIVRTFWGGR